MKVYPTQQAAESRMRKLTKDGVKKLKVTTTPEGGWVVVGDPGLKKPEPSKFGLLMEDDRVAAAALDVDETAINQFDTGATHALPASVILGTRTRTRNYGPAVQ